MVTWTVFYFTDGYLECFILQMVTWSVLFYRWLPGMFYYTDGYLAEAYDEATDAFLIGMLSDRGTTGYGPWIGARYSTSVGTWIWVNSQQPVR